MFFVDFAVLPPEVISTQIYAGPGAEPMLAAAAAWQRLASELHSTAYDYGLVISELVESWVGPSSASMAAAVAPYVTWLTATAAQAEQTATQATAAAGAYQAAFAAVVPPADVVANRVQLQSLVATNLFGQNGAAIAATEGEYGQMWAQDVAAMFAYASASAAAGDLNPFTPPPPTTDGTAEAAQATAAASSVLSWIHQIEALINTFVSDYTKFWQQLITAVTGNPDIAPLWEALYSSISGVGSQGTWTNVVNSTTGMGISQWKNFFIYAPWAKEIPKSALAGGLSSGRAATALVKPASAIVGAAPTVGGLSVPPSWASATPAIRLASNGITSVAAAPTAAGLPAGVLDEANLGSFMGGALGSPAARVINTPTGKQAARATATERRIEPVKLDRIIAQLQEQPDKVQHWSVDEAGLDDLVAKLRTTPGVHAVHVLDSEEAAAGAPPELQSK